MKADDNCPERVGGYNVQSDFVLEMCLIHKPTKLRYLEVFKWAEKLSSEGKVKSQCFTCGYWFFPHEQGNGFKAQVPARPEVKK